MFCEKHEFHWDISDPMGCPVCYGEGLAEERIINLLDVIEYPNGNETKFQTLVNTVFEGEMLFGDFRRELIALIKGEK